MADLNDDQKACLMIVYEMTKLDGAPCATTEALVERTGWSEERVVRVMTELLELGYMNRAGAEGPN